MKILEKFVINDSIWIEVAIVGFGINKDTAVNLLQVYRYDRATVTLHTEQ